MTKKSPIKCWKSELPPTRCARHIKHSKVQISRADTSQHIFWARSFSWQLANGRPEIAPWIYLHSNYIKRSFCIAVLDFTQYQSLNSAVNKRGGLQYSGSTSDLKIVINVQRFIETCLVRVVSVLADIVTRRYVNSCMVVSLPMWRKENQCAPQQLSYSIK